MNPEKFFAPDKRVPLLLGSIPKPRQSIPVDDGEYAVLSPEACYIKDIATGDERNNYVRKI